MFHFLISLDFFPFFFFLLMWHFGVWRVSLRGSTLACGWLREGEALIVAKAVSPSRALPLLATQLFCVLDVNSC